MRISDENKLAPHNIWMPVNGTDTVNVGSLVQTNGDGVSALGLASGAADTTGEKIPLGLVIGINEYTPVFNEALSTTNTSGVVSQADQISRKTQSAFSGVEGYYPKSDAQPMVEVALIGPDTLLEAPLYASSFGTAPALLTATVGSTTGLGFTSNAADVAGIASLGTAHCRTGANAGLSRISTDISATVHTFNRAFQEDIAIGDTFVKVNLRNGGLCRAQFDATSSFVDIGAALAINYYSIIVVGLDLREAGKEKVYFKLTSDHFNIASA